MDTGENEVTLLDLMLVVAENLKLLVLGPLAAGLLVLGIMFLLPKTYTSRALLTLGESGRVTESVMRSPAVLDTVLSKFPVAGASGSSGREALNKKFRFGTGTSSQKLSGTVVTFEVDGESPEHAQELANALIGAWLETTKPPPLIKLGLERKLKLTQNSLVDVLSLISKFKNESGQTFIPKSQFDVASSIAELLRLRDEYSSAIALIENQLLGSTRDVVVSPPTAGSEATSFKKGLISVSAALAVGFSLLLWVFMREAWRTAAQNPQVAEKQSRLRAALGLK